MFTAIFVFLGVLLCVQLWKKLQTTSYNLPPGPKPLPIVGNLKDLPPGGAPEYQHWLKLKAAYGPISSINIFGQPLIILHDRDAARDLLVKSSRTTSSRPSMPFADLCGFGALLNLRSFDSTYRLHRKLVHQQFGTKAVAARFRDTIDVESHRLLLRVLNDPANLVAHIKTEASAIILRITYGYSIAPQAADPLVVLIERTMDVFVQATTLLAWPVDGLPFLKYLPEGLPGTSFKKTAREWGQLVHSTLNVPYAFVQRQMAKGTHELSYVSSLIEQSKETDDGAGKLDENIEDAIKKTAAVMYGGGADTTSASIHGFILAMILFPEVQKKAQEEIDTVVGSERLPQYGDRDHLPYVNALVKESFRWHHVAPLGVPHKVDEETSYGGFQIPKGAYLVPSIWWFLHDPQTYPDPSSFNPDRYLEPRNEPDPADEAFGFGRRICPGRFLADETLFITISRLLAAFNMTKAVDESGNEIDPEMHSTPGLISRLLDFPYSIKPRSARYTDLIKSVEVEHPWEENDACDVQTSFQLR
ncbi:hypothetical protein diail_4701 [Diaporthe ilicicola]|nr:hypothetical protein diail_4701 [Diaporthe ilicicola]